MKEIKTKPAGGQPRTLDKGGVVPKTAMKEMWLHTKDKTLSETMETPFASQQEATGNAPAIRCCPVQKPRPRRAQKWHMMGAKK